MKKIDAHIHYYGNHPDCIELFERLELKLFNVCVAHDPAWRRGADFYRDLADNHPQQYAWCTSFDPFAFDEPDYAEGVIAQLEKDFAAGAIACKVWKNIGMEIKKPSGEFLMIDDPVFDPIYEYLQKSEVTVLAHIGEPLACWQPLGDDNPHAGYYRSHPEWHMYNRPEFPSHQEIIDARDRMVARFPGLRIVGAHLGSLEYDVAEIAKRLDRFPNFAVDSSARLRDLIYQDSKKVRQFFGDYQDRILFGTDIVMRDEMSTLPESERVKRIEDFDKRYQMEMEYFETEKTVSVGNREEQGLGLPAEILEKFYHGNATRWYPGL